MADPAALQLAVQGASFSYGALRALDNVSLSARSGELIAIVGPNGCGKSTLLRLLIGDLAPTAGEITLDGISIDRISPKRLARHIALVPQQTAATFPYSVQQTVLMARHAAHAQAGAGKARLFPFDFETDADIEIAQRAMWDADVHHLADRPLTALSGGERQRVAIARALAQDTPILLLDEPTAFLDLYHQLELMHQLKTLTAPPTASPSQPRLVIFVTHDLNLAAAHATRILLMDAGRIVADGPPDSALNPSILESVYRVSVTRPGDNSSPALYFSRKERDNGGSDRRSNSH